MIKPLNRHAKSAMEELRTMPPLYTIPASDKATMRRREMLVGIVEKNMSDPLYIDARNKFIPFAEFEAKSKARTETEWQAAFKEAMDRMTENLRNA